MLSGHTDEANGVFSFTSPENNSDLLVVSGSNDCSVRFWTFKEERSLTVLHHNASTEGDNFSRRTRVSEVVIYLESEESTPVFITGCTNGWVYGWSLGADLEGDLAWKTEVHADQVTSLALFYPSNCSSALDKSSEHMNNKLSHARSFPVLQNPLVVSGGRDSSIHVRNLFTGEAVGEGLTGHTDAITAVAVYSGGHFRGGGDAIAPFIVSASEDNDIRIWSLESSACLAVIQDHDSDVTSLSMFAPLSAPPTSVYCGDARQKHSDRDVHGDKEGKTTEHDEDGGINNTEFFSPSADSVTSLLPPLMHSIIGTNTPVMKKRRRAKRTSRQSFSLNPTPRPQRQRQLHDYSSVNTSTEQPKDLHFGTNASGDDRVLIVSCSMDGTVRLYDPDGEVVKVISVEKKMFSFVSVLNDDECAVMAASTMSGHVYVWSLHEPYSCLHVFADHSDEVRSVCVSVYVRGAYHTIVALFLFLSDLLLSFRSGLLLFFLPPADSLCWSLARGTRL